MNELGIDVYCMCMIWGMGTGWREKNLRRSAGVAHSPENYRPPHRRSRRESENVAGLWGRLELLVRGNSRLPQEAGSRSAPTPLLSGPIHEGGGGAVALFFLPAAALFLPELLICIPGIRTSTTEQRDAVARSMPKQTKKTKKCAATATNPLPRFRTKITKNHY